jgi:hypothetical protein
MESERFITMLTRAHPTTRLYSEECKICFEGYDKQTNRKTKIE